MKAIVIGGGIIGASVAWRLASEKVGVTVLERGRLGQEASWAAQGLIAPQAEADGPGPLIHLGIAAKRAFEGITERLSRESGIDFEYDDQGVIYVALDDDEEQELKRRLEWQLADGLSLEELGGADARRLEPLLSGKVRYALRFPNDRRTENRKLTQAYIIAAERAGAEFRESAGVDGVVTSSDRAHGVRLYDGSTHEADVVINAAGSWSNQLRGIERDRIPMRPVRGQILCFEIQPGSLKHSVFSLRGSLVPRRDGRLLAGSTREEAGFNKSVTLGAIARITRGAKDVLPSLGEIPFREAWAGLRPATPDLLPVL